VERLGFPEHELFLDTPAHFSSWPNPDYTNGVRRFEFRWQKPETPEEQAQRERDSIFPEISIAAEVDAVSGNIKALNFPHRWFERPDPKIDVPMHPDASRNESATPDPKAK